MYETLSKGSSVDIIFNIEEQISNIKQNVAGFASYLMNFSGKDSIVAKLKGDNLISTFNASIITSYSDFAQYSVSFTLTNEGEPKLKEIIKMVFSFIEQLKKTQVSKEIFKEYATVLSSDFLFGESSSHLSSQLTGLSQNLFYFTDKMVLQAFDPSQTLDEPAVKRFFASLSVQNAIVMIGSDKKATDLLNDMKFEEKLEKWYTTKYFVTSLDNTFVSHNLRFTLRTANQFLTTNDALLVAKEQVMKVPTKLIDRPNCSFYFFVRK